MDDRSHPTLDELKVRGDAAIVEARRSIAALYNTARESRSTVYNPGRWTSARSRSDAFATNANDLAQDLLE